MFIHINVHAFSTCRYNNGYGKIKAVQWLPLEGTICFHVIFNIQDSIYKQEEV